MNITVTNKINLSPALKKIESDEFWKFSAEEWWRLYYDYVPHDKNRLRQDVKIKPKQIEHFVPYASYIYYGLKQGGGMLKLKNGSRLWDQKAISEKKDLLLISSMQKWINQNL